MSNANSYFVPVGVLSVVPSKMMIYFLLCANFTLIPDSYSHILLATQKKREWQNCSYQVNALRFMEMPTQIFHIHLVPHGYPSGTIIHASLLPSYV